MSFQTFDCAPDMTWNDIPHPGYRILLPSTRVRRFCTSGATALEHWALVTNWVAVVHWTQADVIDGRNVAVRTSCSTSCSDANSSGAKRRQIKTEPLYNVCSIIGI